MTSRDVWGRFPVGVARKAVENKVRFEVVINFSSNVQYSLIILFYFNLV